MTDKVHNASSSGWSENAWGKRTSWTTHHNRAWRDVNAVSVYARDISIKAGSNLETYATRLSATNNLKIEAGEQALYYAVKSETHHTDTNHSSRSWIGLGLGSSQDSSTTRISTPMVTDLYARDGNLTSYSGGDQLLQGTQATYRSRDVRAGVGDKAKADARIILEGVRTTVQQSRTSKSDAVVWQSMSGAGSTTETLALPSFAGGGTFSAPGGLSVQIPDGDFKTQIATLSAQPGMGYLTELTARKDVNWQPVKLAHDQWSYSQEGLTPAGAALLGVAVAWATGGMGASMLGTTGTATSAMANAAFTSLAAQASITLINNKGDIGKTLKDMSSSSTVKATLAAVLTAGVIDKLGATSTLETLRNSGGFSDKLTFNLINATGRALTNTAINGGNLEDTLKAALVGGLVDTAHGEAASVIKGLESQYLAHKLAHALAGCVAGAAAGGACKDGAIGAAIGEVVAQLMPPNNGIAYSNTEKVNVLAMSKLIAGATAAYAGGNAQTAINTAETAVQNNALVPVLIGIAWLADKAWTAYEVSQDLAAIRDGTKTVEQVAREKGEDYVTGIILGNIGRYGVKAVKTGTTWIQSNASNLTKNLEARGSTFGTNISWGSWNDYPKVTIDGKQYAQVGDRIYSQHAVDRMQPSGLGIPAGADAPGRNVSPNIVDYVIRTGEKTTSTTAEGVQRTIHWSGNVGVVTEDGGKVVVTVLRRGS